MGELLYAMLYDGIEELTHVTIVVHPLPFLGELLWGGMKNELP